MPRKRKTDPNEMRRKLDTFADVDRALRTYLVATDPKYLKQQEYFAAHRPNQNQQPEPTP